MGDKAKSPLASKTIYGALIIAGYMGWTAYQNFEWQQAIAWVAIVLVIYGRAVANTPLIGPKD